VYERVKLQLQTTAEQLRDEGIQVCLRPETSGRASQFGSLEEILKLSEEIPGVGPCIDFGHLHARAAGAMNTYTEFGIILKTVRDTLGPSALEDMHVHLQGIAYGEAGERKHLVLTESDMQYGELLQALVDWRARGTVICESPNLEDDAVLLQQTYRRLAARPLDAQAAESRNHSEE
jgi:deoxyribonuclease-4